MVYGLLMMLESKLKGRTRRFAEFLLFFDRYSHKRVGKALKSVIRPSDFSILKEITKVFVLF